MDIREAIRTVVGGSSLTQEQAFSVFACIMDGATTDAQIAALLVALRLKGETVPEIVGASRAMRERATLVPPSNPRHLVDTCGTGGDDTGTFNISTASAFVAAAAGARVAKHGNRSVSSKCGSADVLEALGVNVGVAPEIMKRCLDEIGICFLFAPSLHKAMKYAAGPRKEIGIRTIFNILGPLTNPSKADAQVLGVFSTPLTVTLAEALLTLGAQRAYVVHGQDGLDEFSISGPSHVAEVCDGKVTTYTVHPADFNLTPAPVSAIKGGTPEQNAAIISGILNNQPGPCTDIVILNAAFAITAAEIAATPVEGIERARNAIVSGAAKAKLESLKKATAS